MKHTGDFRPSEPNIREELIALLGDERFSKIERLCVEQNWSLAYFAEGVAGRPGGLCDQLARPVLSASEIAAILRNHRASGDMRNYLMSITGR